MKRAQSKFQNLYKNLNKEQKKAVDTIDGPVMVIAGPGTGKTHVLTMRIANILLKTQTDPQSILALTFTESGAKAMKEKLKEIIGTEAYYVNIYTFHSFCSDLIREFPEKFALQSVVEDDEGTELTFVALSDLERIQIFKEILDEGKCKLLKPFGSKYYYVRYLVKAIQDLKREGVNETELEKLIDKEAEDLEQIDKINPRTKRPSAKYLQEEKNIAKLKELLKIYKVYQKKIRKIGRFDFEDMINFVVEQFEKDEDFKATLQERYHYILVDEYQDTNSAQNQVIKHLTDIPPIIGDPNIFVVGDDEQAIYRFQGASLENILFFKKLYPNCETIVLTSNYRNTQLILDASRGLIRKNALSIEKFLKDVDKNLKAQLEHRDVPIEINRFSQGEVENYFLASEVNELLSKKVKLSEIAIFVRNNRDVDDIAEMLDRFSIPHQIAAGEDILQDGDINKLLNLFKLIADLKKGAFSDDVLLFTVLNYEFFSFDSLDILKLSRAASFAKTSLFDAMTNDKVLKRASIKESKKFKGFAQKLAEWGKLEANVTFAKFFEEVVNKSGFLNWVLGGGGLNGLNDLDDLTDQNKKSTRLDRLDRFDRLDQSRTQLLARLNTFFTEIKRLNHSDHALTLDSFLQNIELMKENGIKIEADAIGQEEGVNIMTAHKAKGLEFEYVFIAKCIDKKWGNNVMRELIKLPKGIIENIDLDKKEKNEDERRLFYVAITRAKKEVYITFADKYKVGTTERETVPSMFIGEIKSRFKLIKADRNRYEQMLTDDLETMLRPKDGEIKDDEKTEETFLTDVLARFKLSPTSLQTYLNCPYKFKLNNILRTPRAKEKYLALGTGVHKALELFFAKFKKTNKVPPEKYLITEFEKALKQELMTEEDYKDSLSEGKEALAKYYENYKASFEQPLLLEYNFGFRRVYLNNIPLTGKVDRVDWVDKDKRQVRVVDYKTSKPKSRNEIEGKTKWSKGELLRQLVFYKLLTQLDSTFNQNVIEGELDFVKPDDRGRFRKEAFEYDSGQVEDFKTLIRKTYQKIMDLKFGRTKEYENCERCEYKEHCWPEGIPGISN